MDRPLIIISNGMAKSASTVLCSHTLALMRHHYPVNGQLALCKAVASGRLKGVAHGNGTLVAGAFIGNIRAQELEIISEIAAVEGPLLVKTHSDIDPALVQALREGRVRMTFTHRDPRDMLLSAMDHCVQTRESQKPSLQEFTSIQDSLASAQRWANMACNWACSGLPLCIRYVDFVAEPVRELARVAEYLGMPVEMDWLEKRIERERGRRTVGRARFNRGELHRFTKEMSAEEQELCNRELGDFITKLGYPL